MIEYVLNGGVLGLLGFLLLKTLEPAVARVRLLVCLATILIVAIPWYWASAWLPLAWEDSSELPQPVRLIGLTYENIRETSAAIQPGFELSVAWIFTLLVSIGLIAFISISLQQYRKIRIWRHISRPAEAVAQQVPDNIHVWIVPNGNQAVATFFGSQEIWIGEHLIDHPKLEVALLHECIHHELNHPKIEWLLTFFRCLCWWHPLVWMFVGAARREVELECDERCASSLGARPYQQDLAELLIDVNYDTIGAGFGGRKSFDVARIRKLSARKVLGALRKSIAGALVLVSVSAFFLVHAESVPQTNHEHRGWNVRMENVDAVKVFEQIAEMGGLVIYIDPSLGLGVVNFTSAAKVKDWPPLMDGVAAELGIEWVERGGALFVGSSSSVDDISWIPQAVVVRGHGPGIFGHQNKDAHEGDTAIRVNLKLEEKISDEDFRSYQMEFLIGMDAPAAVRQGKIHITFEASGKDGDAELAVGLFKVAGDSSMTKIGSGNVALVYGTPNNFEWSGEDGLIYDLSLTPTLENM